MRIDKYLWSVRYFKTRSIATKACRKGHVRINNDVVKPSREVYPSDRIQVRKNQINYQIEVIDLPKSRVGAKLVSIYCIDKTPKEDLNKLELLKHTQDYYRKKGTGRPTKKDRREIDDWLDPEKEDKHEN
ncbi:RNA-binding S4 domain-containing protein [Psychroflexus sp. ALD_RP9]|uniref:RNA-binding S4 domain-containing protein n=1 Tax=Psychroflexus sp. ALD_RP9 TaxID=2777186 RepID=UPI001A8EDF34|nr:RNA-binding S4 domain-containing protein [Psychroflexus sp. ALD_RP9]QSS97610.1 RNA-binding S4 domain-containing protein [Psychroflexus sp. ALD_RP9]